MRRNTIGREPAHKAPPPPVSYSVDTLCAATGIPRSSIYAAMSSGQLEGFKIGRRRLFTAEAVQRWIGRHAAGQLSEAA
jgi:excisionase family DNA binding protein